MLNIFLFVVGLVLGGAVGSLVALGIVALVLHLTEDWRDSHGWL